MSTESKDLTIIAVIFVVGLVIVGGAFTLSSFFWR